MTDQAARIGALFCALAIATTISSTSLAGETWDGGGINNNWTTPLN